ncbi:MULTISPECIES: sensor histidine kinase [Streptomyces]|uniref:histidine kinase n=1 Tax=Streptomyces doudnae TaxID=3075536 RepID=A0ABD5EKN9_9ACTN|nr:MULTISPECIES: nitrate- and nitrite sensing domain-containing protein [unclassified Streptomyces]MDT0434880.1 nitrate- and nitrite sensing domain-containing protein [Streptomyces sp. DSM 41981]MYQ63309.1 HAMP domain-containing protein [Streptomyces sp. SID4950]SCD55700.1 Signal transduction histidine kinase [Streptomyces sp. SolWspMP-5a-2]
MRRSKNGPEPSARGNFTPPPRGAAPAPASGPQPDAAASSGGRLSPRNWRVPTRLNAILLIPVLVGLVMGGFQVKSSIDTWQDAEDAENTARLVRASLSYADALYNERDITTAPLLKGKSQTAADKKTVSDARATTDKAADAFDRAAQNMPAKPGLERRLTLFRAEEPKIAGLRAAAYTAKLPAVQTEEGYVTVAHPLMEFANELGLGTGNITSYGRTVYAISLTKAALSLERAIGMHLLINPGPDDKNLAKQRVALSSYAYLEGIAVEEYIGGGTEADAQKLTQAEAKLKTDGAELAKKAEDDAAAKGETYVAPPSNPTDMVTALSTLGSTDTAERAQLAERGITAQNWWAVNTLKYNVYRQIEADLADKAVGEASDIASGAQRDAIITGAAVVVALLLAFILAGAVARQMSRSMRQLRSAAFGIAEQRLPTLVDQLSRTDPGRVDTRVAPIPIHTKDEIGEVARAFDQVHREAVRLASEQALLRGNINAIFTNLSRRNQSLIEGQLTLITDLENNEADPDQLENLFRLDHLATRMRRNGENLLVLAGEEPGRRWDQPVPLVDVLRAASSEVEQYERVELSGVPEAEIHGRAVTDLVHLLAELLENATTFSSPQTKVRVTATRLPDGRVMIEIHDKGIGLTAEDFADINHKLANPPTVDAAISQRMGLFVVGRLSDRHGIRVQLRPSGEQAGTTSLVMLPDAITHGGGGGEQRLGGEEFTVSQIMPEQGYPPLGEDFAQPPAPHLRTAAELGFDDSQYGEVPDDIRELDPAGRAPEHGERPGPAPARPQGEHGPRQPAEGAQFGADGFDARPAYDDAQGGYPAQGGGFDAPPAYQEPQQAPYEEQQRPAYEEPYYAPDGALPQTDAFSAPHGFQDSGYPESGQDPQADAGAARQDGFPSFDQPSYQDDWPQQDGYQNGYQAEYAPEAESTQGADGNDLDRVGFDRPGPTSSASHELTDAGLPRRGSGAGNGARHAGQEAKAPGADGNGGNGTTGGIGNSDGGLWQSANDERWQQASQLRKPKAGGVTSSGLPRRVPKANLVEGAAESTPQGGPQISRAPEDIRGRLSNLRRGVQRGRNAGSEKNGQGLGPDSTYDQER